jgi:hypothetical protein
MISFAPNSPYENEKGGGYFNTGPVMDHPWETLNQGVVKLSCQVDKS